MGRKRRSRTSRAHGDRTAQLNSSASQLNPSGTRRSASVQEYDGTDISDSESCATNLTLDDDALSIVDDVQCPDDLVNDEASFCDKLDDLLSRASHKNISIRSSALSDLILLLVKHCVPSRLEKFQETISDVIEKALKKGDDEANYAAHLVALMSSHLSEAIGDGMESILNTLLQLCLDSGRPIDLRVQCARSVTIFCLLTAVQSDMIAQSADALRSIWINTKSNTLHSTLFSAALTGWALLISQAGSETLKSALLDQPKLCTYVDGMHVDVRLSAGEALAVIHETAVATFGDKFHFPNEQHLLNMFATLSNDSLKFRGKKDKRIQRFNFRQIYTAIKEHQIPSATVKFGTETLVIDSCAKKLFYALICGVLHGGLNTHLRLNTVIRDWFDLGPVIEQSSYKMPKTQRVAIQNAVNKMRDLQRSKQRDKRIAC